MRIGDVVRVLIVRQTSDHPIEIRRGIKTLSANQRGRLKDAIRAEIFTGKKPWGQSGVLIVPARDWVEVKKGICEVGEAADSDRVLYLGDDSDYVFRIPDGQRIEVRPNVINEGHANLIIWYTAEGGFDVFRNGKPAMPCPAHQEVADLMA
jgi:hypothetical protein